MSYLLDTDICIYLLNEGSPALYEQFQKHARARICVSTITEAELYYGALHSQKSQQNRERVVLFLDPLETLPFDSQAAQEFAMIKEAFTKKGNPIGVMDMLIAAVAKAQGMSVVTNNQRHFTRVRGLKVENWL
jgi:tRNA(fMet)-specific endonuclease VapC